MSTSSAEARPIESDATGRLAGGVLLAASILTIVAMAHHPTGHAPAGGQGSMSLGGFIHATMIVLLAANLWGLTIFSMHRRFDGWMLAGLLAYAISIIGNVIAATINGFIVPAVAAGVDHAGSSDLFVLLWQSNQAFAKLGTYAASAAILAWSTALISHKTPAHVIVGGLGVLAALIPAGELYAGIITLNVHGALIVYGAHAAWIGLIGIQMLRRAL